MKRVISVLVTILILALGFANIMADSDHTTSFNMTFKWHKNKATTSITSIDGVKDWTRDRYVEARLVKWNTYTSSIVKTYQKSSNSDSTESRYSDLSTTTDKDDNSEINRSYHFASVSDTSATAGAMYIVKEQRNYTHKYTISF